MENNKKTKMGFLLHLHGTKIFFEEKEKLIKKIEILLSDPFESTDRFWVEKILRGD